MFTNIDMVQDARDDYEARDYELQLRMQRDYELQLRIQRQLNEGIQRHLNERKQESDSAKASWRNTISRPQCTMHPKAPLTPVTIATNRSIGCVTNVPYWKCSECGYEFFTPLTRKVTSLYCGEKVTYEEACRMVLREAWHDNER